MANIPLEIIVDEILPRLPAKSLIRFKCVSKLWLSVISRREFINHHLNYALSSNTNHLLILTGNDHSLSSCNLDVLDDPAVKIPSFGIDPFVVGSCNGLLCIQSYSPYCLVLLNPSTGSSRKIPSLLPPRKFSAMNFGFGYDSQNDDYKIVRIVDRYSVGILGPEMDRILHVYSLKANSWEMIERTSPQDSMRSRENGVLMENHLFHWKFWCPLEGQYRIRSFDYHEKNWSNDVPLPNYREMGSPTLPNHDNGAQDGLLDFGVFDGCLYLSTTNQMRSVVDIWVMNEYRVKESWVKMYQISDSIVLRSLRISPIVYEGLKRRILLRSVNKTEHKIWWYSIDDNTVESVQLYGFEDCCWIDVCKGSLVDVPGGSQLGRTQPKDEKKGL